VGILVTSLLVSTTSGLDARAPLFVYGIGVGLATAQLTSIVLSEIPGSRSGLASGANSTMRQVGSALGVAILGTVLFASLVGQSRDNLAASLPGVPVQCRELIVSLLDASAGQILPALRNPSAADGAGFVGQGAIAPDQAACFADPAFVAALPRTVAPIEDAFVSATHLAGYTALAFVVLGVLFTVLLPDTRLGLEPVLAQDGSTPGEPPAL
jgi:hypothetical protein